MSNRDDNVPISLSFSDFLINSFIYSTVSFLLSAYYIPGQVPSAVEMDTVLTLFSKLTKPTDHKRSENEVFSVLLSTPVGSHLPAHFPFSIFLPPKGPSQVALASF